MSASPLSAREALTVLREAYRYAEPGTRFGYAATVPPEADAYEMLLAQLPTATELRQLLAEASPAGRVYAALLWERVDAAAGRDAWRRLSADGAQLELAPGGCIVQQTTVAEFALERLRQAGA